jgi:hypothetical protein
VRQPDVTQITMQSVCQSCRRLAVSRSPAVRTHSRCCRPRQRPGVAWTYVR